MSISHGKILEVTWDSEETCLVRLTQAGYGSLDAVKLTRLRNELLYLAEHSAVRCMVLDLSEIQYLGAGFVGVLVDTWHLLHKANRRLVLCGLTPYCGRLIRVLHLDKLFDICPAQGTAPECMRRHVACEEHNARGAPFHVRFTEVAWNAEMVREEYLDEDGVPFRSVIRPRQRPTG